MLVDHSLGHSPLDVESSRAQRELLIVSETENAILIEIQENTDGTLGIPSSISQLMTG